MAASHRFGFRIVSWIYLVLSLNAVSAWAQVDGVIRGQVVAAADGSALAGAPVTLRSQAGSERLHTSADPAGRFVFVGVRPGEYILSAASDGFTPRDLRLVVAAREVMSVTLALDVARVAVSVDVVAESPAPSTHSPSSTLLTPERLDRLAQRTNLPDAIVAAAPGMIRGHDDFVHIRGHEVALNPSINGVQFWENAHAVFSPGLGVDYIESINVMTGGFSAEYGNRFGGILDVVTKSGFTMRNRGSVTLGTGTAQRHNLGFELGAPNDRLAYYVNLGGFTSERFLSPPSPRSIHNSGRAGRSFGRLDLRASDRDHITLVATGDGVNFELPMDERDERLRPDFRNLQRARSESAILSWNHVRSSNVVIQTAAYQRWSTVRQLPETLDRYGARLDADRTLDTFGLKSDLTRAAGRHALKGGVDLVLLRPREELYYLSQPWIDFTHRPDINESHVHFRGPNLGAGIPRPVVFGGKETGGQVSLFVQDKVQVTSSLTVDVGVRVDRYSLAMSESHVSPRLNAAFRLPAGTVLFGSYNHFFVLPPVENVLAGSAGLTRFVSEIGRPLPPVRAIKENQFEAGATHPIVGLGTVGITGYYRSSDDPPHTSIFPDSRFYTYASFDKGKAYGMEIKANVPSIGHLGLSGYLNYALGRVWFYNPITAGFTTEAAHLIEVSRFPAPMDQTHTATAGLSYQDARTRLWAAAAVEYGSGTPGGHGAGDHEHETGETHDHAAGPGVCGRRCPSRVTPNVSLGWNAPSSSGSQPRLSVQFNVENVSNTVYLLSKESSMVQGQYSIPRLVSASVKMRF
ncbi:MAG: TonB-dependent receptor [Acidobacteria bacterium]|nr:TonB-dependent receptor [Acidobacteriota bacterium]